MLRPVFGKDRVGQSGSRVPARILAPRLLLIFTTAALLIYGLVMLYSASFVEAFTNSEYGDSAYFIIRQLFFAAAGLVAMAIAIILPYRLRPWPKLIWIIAGLAWLIVVVMLALTLIPGIGIAINGSNRWLPFLGTTIQASEFAKVAVMLCCAVLAVKLRDSWQRSTALMALTVIGLPALLVLMQPDLGTALVIFVGVFAVAWFADYPLKFFAAGFTLVVFIAAVAMILEPFRSGRMDVWINPWDYTQDIGNQIINAAYAFGEGGLTGVGLGGSHQKYLYLSQVQDDMIFPIVGEELGLIGSLLVALLFLAFVFAAFRIAANAPDRLGRVIAGASGAIIGFQAFLNMLCMTGALPMTGKTLPFFSAGGSSIIATLIMVGLILNVSLRSNAPDAASRRRDSLEILDGGNSYQGFAGSAPAQQPQSKWVRQRNVAPLMSSVASSSARSSTRPKPAAATAAYQQTTARPAPSPRQTVRVGRMQPPRQTVRAGQTQSPRQTVRAGQTQQPLRSAKATAAPKTDAARQSPFFNPARNGNRLPAAGYPGKGHR